MSAHPLAVVATNQVAALCQLAVGREEPDFQMSGDVLMKGHHARNGELSKSRDLIRRDDCKRVG